MTDRDPFIRTILDNPDDDGPRLVYADQLEEWGESDYARFIRLQCAQCTCTVDRVQNLGKIEYGKYKKTRCDKHDGELEAWKLKTKYETLWATQFLGHDNINLSLTNRHCVSRWEFRRGFIEVISFCNDWIKFADEIFARNPIQEVNLIVLPPVWIHHVRNSMYEYSLTQKPNGLVPPMFGWDSDFYGTRTKTTFNLLKKRWPQVKNWNVNPSGLMTAIPVLSEAVLSATDAMAIGFQSFSQAIRNYDWSHMQRLIREQDRA